MKPIKTFNVSPSIPEKLLPLKELAYNFRWTWNHATIELFRRLDSELWEKCFHNPVLMLGRIDQHLLQSMLDDEGFMSHLSGVYAHFQRYVSQDACWFPRVSGQDGKACIAYFSAEFGITECLSIFAGGLGVLAGDHLKSASDLGVPLVGVGLLYQEGYFHQYLNEAGWQQESYEENDFYNLPLLPEKKTDGTPYKVAIPFPGRTVSAQIWRASVGRIPLYLLDTNIPENNADDKKITYQLYGGDSEMRIKQEVVLGIGGFQTLDMLGIQPTVFHMNEGHSAFLSIELIRSLMKKYGLTFKEAQGIASAGLLLTSHTPVPAGHDYFPNDLMTKYFSQYAKDLGLDWREFMALGRKNPQDSTEPFCMTTLALRLSSYSNGVSKLHGKVTREMWKSIWPEVPEDEIPIRHVTNGVHIRSWISAEMNLLYDRYLGPRWQEEPGKKEIWEKAGGISGEELWRTHERRRERLVAFVRMRLRKRLEKLGASKRELEVAEEVLNPEILTIGFARRFATYKRATLILKDPERLTRLLNNSQKPVQIIFAGKAHPKDDEGKKLIQSIINLVRRDDFRRKIVFVEEYDMAVARYLVQGVDLWLNTPRRLMEASGTSGMKAAANGVLNMSILDGWWDEAYSPGVGWAIGRGEDYVDSTYQDQIEAEAIYDLLEEDIVPLFYERGVDNLPRKWVAQMKESIANLCYFFNTNRMVQEYSERFYIPVSRRYQQFLSNGLTEAKKLSAWKENIQKNWPKIMIESVTTGPLNDLTVDVQLAVQSVINLGNVTPDDVTVEIYSGKVDALGLIISPETTKMDAARSLGDGKYLFEGRCASCQKSGNYGLTVRVLPYHPLLSTPFLPGLISWSQPI
ncbi:MAG: alpha-glucan family phosphorylase [Thermodesulfobacteriota bacterium]|jgi:starch phosphorylase|nr:MAG: alpha-glucan family phosphorylase [Thermodesulfobacteriota bacterium]